MQISEGGEIPADELECSRALRITLCYRYKEDKNRIRGKADTEGGSRIEGIQCIQHRE